jgi:hypothetical protein
VNRNVIRSTGVFLAASLIGLLAIAPAQAAAPTLVSVGQVKRHPKATWTLPSGSESFVIQVASSPETGSDGSFFTENVEDIDLLESGQTSWLSSSRLDPGTYYVHVGGTTPNCEACPIPEWSETLSLKIRNAKPHISRLRLRDRGTYAIETIGTFLYCDDTSGSGTASIFERYWLRNILSASARYSDYFSIPQAGCTTRTVSWYPPDRVFGVGWHSVRLQVRDDDGRLSNKITRKWFVVD